MTDRTQRPSGRWSLRTRLVLLLAAVAVLLVATLSAQVILQARQRGVRNDLLLRVDPALIDVTHLRSSVAEQDTAVRRHVLADDPDAVASYEVAAGEAADDLDDLEGRVTSVGALAASGDEVAEARGLLTVWQDDTAVPALEAADAAERRAAAAPAVQEAGLERLDAVMAAIDRVEASLSDARETMVARLESASRRTTLAMAVQVVGVVLSGVLLMVGLTRLVVRPLDRLGRDARRVARGELDHPVAATGPPDLVRLGESVEGMRARILTEIEQLNAASADLARQADELARSNQDLEQFAYVASHDLQEPLRKVSSFCQLLQKRYSDRLDARANEYIHYAVDGAKRMQDLINDLLDFSRVGRSTDTFQPVDLGAVVRDVVEMLTPSIDDARATVEVGDLPVVMGDQRLLAATLQNLVGNALKFRGEAPPVIEIAASLLGDPADGEWVISVTDNGIGVDPDYAEQIFVIFKRLHSKVEYSGTGIGLALAKKIAEYHGGRLWLEPSPPPGATFKLALPAHTVSERTTDDAG